jgi:NTP pyrophosphatase (non-canonical NTP hydrolase)
MRSPFWRCLPNDEKGDRGQLCDSVANVTSERVREALSDFVRERDWGQFHTPSNLAKSISIEAAELLECFQWSDDSDEARVREELADVVTYCTLLAERLGLDLDDIVLEKLAVTSAKYPAERSKGRSAKYDAL